MGTETFGEALRRLRGDMSIRDVARLANCGKSHISDLENGRRAPSLAIATALDRALGANGRLVARLPPPPDCAPAPQPHRDEWEDLSELLRRTFLRRGLAAVTLPAIGLEDLKHIAMAINDARRYADKEVAAHLERQLVDCAANDRTREPRQSIPTALGLVAAIEDMAKEAKPDVRHSLFKVGARTAELAGWLYRDIAMPEPAGYWRDRAMEWAQATSDFPMQGYVLLKKSQSAWDQRDAQRMLALAVAAQEGPWRLPPHVQAEAVQQEARGLAMLDGDTKLIESKLELARDLLTQDGKATGIAAHYDEPLFSLQVAICHQESGESERAIETYERWLSPQAFSRRDYGYFLALKGEAFAAAEQPDQAATSGLEALTLAQETNSARTRLEILRLIGRLQPWQHRESVRELRYAILA
ncbi:helix-turn-helix domain-containing protein [Nonomuraea sp. NPDC050451]|uniref:helix-turn-helix domain-containing protein n=1 Tax=Nonomuraea sp. NPDC050451 TaxID=3364364 RepID=UPI0037910FF8